MKLTIETDGDVYTAEFNNIDVSIEQILTALTGHLIALGFSWETIVEQMRDYLEGIEGKP